MIRTQIQLTEDQSTALKSLAAAEGVSMAELIRRSIDQYLIVKNRPDLSEIRRRSSEIMGKYASGRSDISEGHDRHLADIYAEGAE
jgi:hypothetical protein